MKIFRFSTVALAATQLVGSSAELLRRKLDQGDSSSSCLRVLLKSGYENNENEIFSHMTVSSQEGDVFLTISSLGSASIFSGTPEDQGDLLWGTKEIGVSVDDGYLIHLQGDGHLLIMDDSDYSIKWRSNSPSTPGQSYVFGITCDKKRVQVQNEATNEVVWDAEAKLPPPSSCFRVLSESDGVQVTTSRLTTQAYDDNLFVHQTLFGPLEMYAKEGSKFKLLWRSTSEKWSEGEMKSVLQRDANIVTRRNEDENSDVLWALGVSKDLNNFEFGITCDLTRVQIRFQNDGKLVYDVPVLDEPSPDPSNKDCFASFLRSGDNPIEIDDNRIDFTSIDGGVWARVAHRGALEVYRGIPPDTSNMLWESDDTNHSERGHGYVFEAHLQHDGHLFVKKPGFRSGVFQSNTVSTNGDYEFGLTCDAKEVQVRSVSDGRVIYSRATIEGGDTAPIAVPAPTPWPAAAPTPSCFEPLLASNDRLVSGNSRVSGNLFVKMSENGSLDIVEGTPGDEGEVIWQSPTGSTDGTTSDEYDAILQGDSNLIIRGFTSWKSATTDPGENGPYRLGVSCDRTRVQIISVKTGRMPFNVPTTRADTSPAMAPTPEDCRVALLRTGDRLFTEGGKNIVIRTDGYYTELVERGVIEVRGGSPDEPGPLLWESTWYTWESDSGFEARLQEDGHMWIRRTVSKEYVWRSEKVGPIDIYVFGVTCDYTRVQIWSETTGKALYDWGI